jgi:hypothetical protein
MGAPVLARDTPEPLIAVAPRTEPLGDVAVEPSTVPLPLGVVPVPVPVPPATPVVPPLAVLPVVWTPVLVPPPPTPVLLPLAVLPVV